MKVFIVNSILGFIFLMLGILNIAHGQAAIKEYFTKDGKLTEDANGYYYLVGKKVEFFDTKELKYITSYVDTVRTYYLSTNTLRSRAIYSSEGFLNGNYILYHENGKIKEKGIYFEDKRVGYFMSWYSNGRPFKTLQYTNVEGYSLHNFKIINYWDSLGNQVVTNGNGFCKCYLINDDISEQGKVVEGNRDSIWTGISNDTILFTENYNKGVLLKGTSYYNLKEYSYTEFDHAPEFKGGFKEMNKVILKNLKYPTDAKRMNIEGTVYVSFVVGVKGTASDFKLEKGIGASCDKEALRVMSLLKDWTPAMQRGKPVNVKFVYPIKFKLD